MSVTVNRQRCHLCAACVAACPFSALFIEEGQIRVNEACRLCGACVEACPREAIAIDTATSANGAAGFDNGVLAVLQMREGELLPISYELVGEGARLAARLEQPLHAAIACRDATGCAEALAGCGVTTLFRYESPALAAFRDDLYAAAMIDCIERLRPAIALFGGTPEGRSVAPRVAVRFRTGLTADCTELFLDEKGLLVQVRPAFGGNVMAQIITEHARPQMLTLRKGVMPPVRRNGGKKPAVVRRSPPGTSRLEVLETRPAPPAEDIAQAEILLAVGGGVARREDIPLFEEWARSIGAMLASSRALVEKGWMPPERQIGLSGQAVSPKLLILCGISGSVQFRAGIRGAKRIIAINNAADAPVFSVAHEYAVGDLYELLPAIAGRLQRP